MNTEFPEAESLPARWCVLFAEASRASNRPIHGHCSEAERRRETDHLSSLLAPARKHPDTASADRRFRANELRVLTFHCAAIDSRRSRPSIEHLLAARATNFRNEYPDAACSHRTVHLVPGQLEPL